MTVKELSGASKVPHTAKKGQGSEIDQTRLSIVATREDLGRTIEELADKLNVKARLTEKMQRGKEQTLRFSRSKRNRIALGAVVAGLVGLVSWLVVRRRK